jgi:uncharacterized membrane protein
MMHSTVLLAIFSKWWMCFSTPETSARTCISPRSTVFIILSSLWGSLPTKLASSAAAEGNRRSADLTEYFFF